MTAFVVIDPGGALDYSVDWTDWLPAGDAIAPGGSTWSVFPVGPLLSSEQVAGKAATVTLSGCMLGQVYELTNRITTDQGRTSERSITVRCEQR